MHVYATSLYACSRRRSTILPLLDLIRERLNARRGMGLLLAGLLAVVTVAGRRAS